MNKGIKRIIAGGMGLLMMASPALAEDASLRELTAAAGSLMLDTENVTLHVGAGFSWDGTEFKRLGLDMAQEGTTSYQKVEVTTVGDEETVDGYTVYGENGRVHSINIGQPYYEEAAGNLRQSLCRNSPSRTAVLGVLTELSTSLDEKVTTASGDQGIDWTLSIKAGETPALTDSMLSFVASTILQRRGYPNDEMTLSGYVEYEDYDQTMNAWIIKNDPEGEQLIEAMQGADLTDDMIRRLDNLGTDMVDSYQALLSAGGWDGMLYVRKDGTAKWYAGKNEMLRGEKIIPVMFERYDQTLMAYYAKTVGKDVTEDEYYAAVNSWSYEAYEQFVHEVEDAYRSMAETDPDTVLVYVYKDGTVKAYDDYGMAFRLQNTLTSQILNGFSGMKINTCDINATTDHEGRLTSANGSLSLMILDRDQQEHTLDITLDVTAKDYGTTVCPRFDSETIGLPSQQEYWEQ